MVQNDETGTKEPYVEDILITIGDDVNLVRRLMKRDKATGKWSYSAADVVEYLRQAWDRAAMSDVEDTELKEIRQAVASRSAHDVTDFIIASSAELATDEHQQKVESIMDSIQKTLEKEKTTSSPAQD